MSLTDTEKVGQAARAKPQRSRVLMRKERSLACDLEYKVLPLHG